MRPPDPHFKSSDRPSPLSWQTPCCPHSCALCTHLSAFFLFAAPKTSPWQINWCLVLSAQVTVNEADGAVPYNALCLPSLSEPMPSSFLTGAAAWLIFHLLFQYSRYQTVTTGHCSPGLKDNYTSELKEVREWRETHQEPKSSCKAWGTINNFFA